MFNENFLSLTERKINNNIYDYLLKNPSVSKNQKKKLEEKSFHEIIQNNRDRLIIQKDDIKKENIFKDILNHLEKLNVRKSIRLKTRMYSKKSVNYNLHELEIMKKKKIKFDKKNLLKGKSLVKRNNSFLNKKYSINNSASKIKSHISSNNSCIIKNIIIKHFDKNNQKNILNKSNSGNSIVKEERIRKLNKIINICKGEIKHGNHVCKNFEEFNNKISENIKERMKRDSKEDINLQDQKILGKEPKEIKDKYKIKEIENFNDIKKKIDMKISEVFAYFNRKEYNKKIKGEEALKSYELYLKDINKINKKFETKKKIEKENINKIKNILEDTHRGKEYLENKINEYDDKYKKFKDINENLDFNEENNRFDILDPPSDTNQNKKMIILPKILLRKKNNYD